MRVISSGGTEISGVETEHHGLRSPADLGLFGVLATKLEPRYQRPGIVRRTRLLARLGDVRTPMIALIAPPGYGKSTTLSQLGESGGRNLAWLSADSRDSDPVNLLRSMVAAIDRVAPLPSETIERVAGAGPAIWAAAVPSIGAVFKAEPSLTLVIDDVDRILAPAAIDVLVALVDNVRGSGRVVIAGRDADRLPVGRLTAQGLLTTFDRDDLALDLDETRDVLTAADARLDARGLRSVAERTEGWPAGVYLTALASARPGLRDDPVSVVAPDRLIEQFFRSEILDGLDDGEAELMLSSSVLERLSGPLCDAVLGRRRSGAILDRLERTNLFLIPLDRDRTWYRFHHLLADFLRAELERADPAAASEIRRRAAAWHEANGLPEAALEYALVAGDEERAARLTAMLAQGVMNTGRIDTVRRWFGWLDDRAAGTRYPGLAASAAMIFALDGDGARAERWADIADIAEVTEVTDPAGQSDRGTAGYAAGAVCRVLLARRGLARFVEDAEIAERTVPDGDPWRVAVLCGLGVARQLQGDVEAADRLLLQAVARWNETRTANAAVCLALTQLTANALERGDRVAAAAHLRQARVILIENHLTEHAVALGIDALDARLAITHGALEQSRADLAHAQRLRPRVGYALPWLAIRSRLELARAHMAMGDGGGARTVMAEIQEILVLRPEMGTLLTERDELALRLAAIRGGEAGASTLTIAELRLLPLLTTHLTFREIGERLFVSQNTVKTQAISIYRKLDATSRSEAIERAVAVGLLESSTSERFIPAG